MNNRHHVAALSRAIQTALIGSSLLAMVSQAAPVQSNTLSFDSPKAFLKQIGINPTVKNQLRLQSATSLDRVSRLPAQLNLVDNFGNRVQAKTKLSSMETNGEFVFEGELADYPNSQFMIQGNDKHLWGWAILDDKTAIKYDVVNGKVVVSPIDPTEVRPVCDLHPKNPDDEMRMLRTADDLPQAATPAVRHVGAYDGSHVGKLQSRPGSAYVILIDTKSVMTDGVPFDVSKEWIWETWQIVAASFSMFDVNVTTDWDVYNAAAPSKRGGGTMYRQTGRSSCAFAFGSSTFCTLYKESTAYGQGRTAAHEFGHLFHLNHDGGAPGGEYHEGIAEFQWVPIMGNYWFGTNWGQALYQWSKGEYSGASNKEDDFNILTRFIPFKTDDISDTKALVIESNGNVSANANFGQIHKNTDSDAFSFSIGSQGGTANLTINRIEHIGGAMLDVHAKIKNSAGQVVAESNRSVNRSASFNQALSAGNYTLEILGGAEGTPSKGFSNYSSLGYYAIEGSIIGGGVGTNVGPKADFTYSSNRLTVNFTDKSTDDKAVTSYAWDFGDGTYATSANPSHTYQKSGSYSVSLVVSDAEGVTSTKSMNVSVSGDVVNPPPAANFSVVTKDLTATFTNTSTDDKAVVAHQWQFGDGSTSSEVSPVHTYPAAGSYSVVLTVSDAEGQTHSKSQVVSVKVADPIGCDGLSPWDTAKPYGSGDRVSYNNSKYLATWWSTGARPDLYSNVWKNEGKCSGSGSNLPPVANFSVSTNGLSVTLSDSSTDDNGVTSRLWNFGDNQTSTQTNPSHSYAQAGTYTISLTVQDAQGLSNTKSTSVTVSAQGNGCTSGVWSSSKVYVSGEKAQLNNKEYQAQWWNQGANPEQNSGQWQVWKLLGACN